MKLLNRENQLPLRGRGYEIICPQCKADYINEGKVGKYNIRCPTCGFLWRVDDRGCPKVVAIKDRTRAIDNGGK